MKTILYAAALCTLVACTQTSTTESVTQKSEPATTEVASTETLTPMASAAAPDPDASADPAKKTTAKKATKQEKKPMDYSKTIAEIHTSSGEIDVRFFPDKAPNHVKNFIDLAQSGFYNGIKFHRVIPGFMIQGGDPNTKSGAPNSWGTGGSPNKLKAEFNDIKHTRGILSAARTSDPNSASSQFFVMVATAPSLDNQYSVFGQVVKGMEVADKIVNAARDANDRPNNPTSIERIVIREAKPGEIPAAK